MNFLHERRTTEWTDRACKNDVIGLSKQVLIEVWKWLGECIPFKFLSRLVWLDLNKARVFDLFKNSESFQVLLFLFLGSSIPIYLLDIPKCDHAYNDGGTWDGSPIASLHQIGNERKKRKYNVALQGASKNYYNNLKLELFLTTWLERKFSHEIIGFSSSIKTLILNTICIYMILDVILTFTGCNDFLEMAGEWMR